MCLWGKNGVNAEDFDTPCGCKRLAHAEELPWFLMPASTQSGGDIVLQIGGG